MSEEISPWILAGLIRSDPGPLWMAAITAHDPTVAAMETREILDDSGTTADLLEPEACEDLVAAFRKKNDATWLVCIEAWSDREWARFDRARSRLNTKRSRFVFFLTNPSARAMAIGAPNAWSFIAPIVRHVGVGKEYLPNDDRETRLARLRDEYRLSDQEILALAKSGSLPAGPDFAEWLILLEGGDLIGRGAQ